MTITDAPTPGSGTPGSGTPAAGAHPTDAAVGAGPVATAQALYEAFGQGDLPGLLDRIHPDVDWSTEVSAPGAELVPMFRNGRGHDAVRRYFAGVAELEFHVFAPVAFHEDGDLALVELSMDVSHRGTGKRAQFDEVHRFVVRDGLVVHYRHFADTASFIELFRP